MTPSLPSRFAEAIRGARSILVLSGAGMSAESGIATFRGTRGGLWSDFNPADLATPQAWKSDPALVWGWYLWRMAGVRAAEPHAGYAALAELARRVPELRVVTQNVDDLHERAGLADITHLHGELFAHRCAACARPHPDVAIPPAQAPHPERRIEPPRCRHCGGRIRPGVVWFGESLPEAAWNEAVALAGRCELMLVVGTSGVVYPAAGCPPSRGNPAPRSSRSTRKKRNSRPPQISPCAHPRRLDWRCAWRKGHDWNEPTSLSNDPMCLSILRRPRRADLRVALLDGGATRRGSVPGVRT